MRIAKVIGNVTLNRSHPSFEGARLRLVIPLSNEELVNDLEPQGDSIAVWDDLGSGDGSLIGLAEGPEANQPFRPELKPVDAYAAALLDTIEVHRTSK